MADDRCEAHHPSSEGVECTHRRDHGVKLPHKFGAYVWHDDLPAPPGGTGMLPAAERVAWMDFTLTLLGGARDSLGPSSIAHGPTADSIESAIATLRSARDRELGLIHEASR